MRLDIALGNAAGREDAAIILGEVTDYAAAWKAGQSWATGPVPIPLAYVTSAGSIWKRGEAYHFDPSRPAPACWVPGSNSLTRLLAASVIPISTTDRALPGELKPGTVGQIQIPVTPPSTTTCYALEEKPPRDWVVSNISHNGTFDLRAGTIRWGVFFDNTPRTFSYTVTPPAGVTSVGAFGGQLSFDGQLVDISSSNSVVFDGVAPMQITDCRLTTTGATLQITGPAGQTAVIERSTNFNDWTELQSIFIPNGGIEFTDDSKPAANSFYRLRVQ